MRLRNTLLAAACGLCLATGSAQAAIISGTWTFSASGFDNGFGTFSGSFTFSFDNSANIFDSAALTVNSLTPNPFGPIGFTYLTDGGILGIGGLITGAGAVSSSTVDFLLVFVDVSTAPSLSSVSVANGGPLAMARSVAGGFTPGPVPVPEPASLALLGAGLLGLGFARRRAPAG